MQPNSSERSESDRLTFRRWAVTVYFFYGAVLLVFAILTYMQPPATDEVARVSDRNIPGSAAMKPEKIVRR